MFSLGKLFLELRRLLIVDKQSPIAVRCKMQHAVSSYLYYILDNYSQLSLKLICSIFCHFRYFVFEAEIF